jgi:hypothetical protein
MLSTPSRIESELSGELLATGEGELLATGEGVVPAAEKALALDWVEVKRTIAAPIRNRAQSVTHRERRNRSALGSTTFYPTSKVLITSVTIILLAMKTGILRIPIAIRIARIIIRSQLGVPR